MLNRELKALSNFRKFLLFRLEYNHWNKSFTNELERMSGIYIQYIVYIRMDHWIYIYIYYILVAIENMGAPFLLGAVRTVWAFRACPEYLWEMFIKKFKKIKIPSCDQKMCLFDKNIRSVLKHAKIEKFRTEDNILYIFGNCEISKSTFGHFLGDRFIPPNPRERSERFEYFLLLVATKILIHICL